MTPARNRWASASLAASLSASLVAAAGIALAGEPSAIPMTPGKGLSLDVGNKHTMTYYEQKDGACGITIVVAAIEGGMTGSDTPGTRISTTVMPGTAFRLDAANAQSAEFFCGPAGRKMNAKVFEREGYSKDGKKS